MGMKVLLRRKKDTLYPIYSYGYIPPSKRTKIILFNCVLEMGDLYDIENMLLLFMYFFFLRQGPTMWFRLALGALCSPG